VRSPQQLQRPGARRQRRLFATAQQCGERHGAGAETCHGMDELDTADWIHSKGWIYYNNI